MLGTAALALTYQGSAGAAEIKLKMAHWLPPVHHMTNTAGAWIKSVEAASGGTIKITLDKNALAKPPGQYDLAKNGVRDLSWSVGAYTPGRAPLFRFAEVPFASPNAKIGSAGHNKWYVKHGFDKKEMLGTVLITSWVHGPGMLHSKKEVRRIEDMKGIKIRVGGGGVLTAKSLGAVPVVQSATQSHESLQRGTTEAAFFPWEAVHGFRLAGLVKYHLMVPGGLYTTPFALNMNRKKWDGLPAAARKALMDAGGANGAALIGALWDKADQVGHQDAIKAGNKVQTLSPAEQKRWAKAVRVITDNWIAKGNKMGLDGKAIMDELVKMMKAG
ncbi:MAG: hypothetical protein CMM10_12650 [Rhodospirillaceae bacterium]|nr:hypothetical protein [Rhodospirillaceae bacterium]